ASLIVAGVSAWNARVIEKQKIKAQEQIERLKVETQRDVERLKVETQRDVERLRIEGCGIGLLGGPGGAVSENGRLRQGAGGYSRGDRRRRGLVLPSLLRSHPLARLLQIVEKSGPIPIFPRYSHVDSHWVLREVDPVRSRWGARGPDSV